MKKILVVFLSLILVYTMTAAEMPLIVFAKESGKSSSGKKSQTDKEIEADKAAISDAEEEKKKIEKSMDGVQEIIKGLEAKKGDLEGYVTQLDSSLAGIQSEINGLNGQIEEMDAKITEIKVMIEEKKNDIKVAKSQLEQAEQVCQQKYEETKTHIRYMYQKGTSTYVDVLFSASGVQDLYNKAEYINSLAEYDKGQLDEYAMIKQEVADKKQCLESEKNVLEDLEQQAEQARDQVADQKAQVKEKEKDVKTLIAAKEQEIGAYEADISSKEAQIKEYKDMIAAQDALIRSLEAAIAAKQQSGEETGRKNYDGGQFTFPAPSYTRISDDYGNRIHPTLGVQQFHNGVDLAAPSGSPILAAYDGQIIAADYSSTMGNYIMIDHGDGLFTIYMHASSLLVSKGSAVTKGQKIALVGSTGRSTGPHLHFSVRQNGNYVSPWKFLG